MALIPAGDITLLLSAGKSGDEDGNEQPGHTLQPTALVNEVYLKLLGNAGAGKDTLTSLRRVGDSWIGF
jgi:hypothetical protein